MLHGLRLLVDNRPLNLFDLPENNKYVNGLFTAFPADFEKRVSEIERTINPKATTVNDPNLFTDLTQFPGIADAKEAIKQCEDKLDIYLREIRQLLKMPQLTYVTKAKDEVSKARSHPTHSYSTSLKYQSRTLVWFPVSGIPSNPPKHASDIVPPTLKLSCWNFKQLVKHWQTRLGKPGHSTWKNSPHNTIHIDNWWPLLPLLMHCILFRSFLTTRDMWNPPW